MASKTVPIIYESRGAAVIASVGASRLALDEIASFGDRLLKLASDYAGCHIVLDLSAVTFLSSVVIGELFKARKQLLLGNGRLSLVVKSPSVQDVLEACQLDRILPIYSTVEQALARKT